MNAAPTRIPQSEPRPATATPMRSSSESRIPNSLGSAKPLRGEHEQRAGDAGERGGDAEGERLVDGELDPRRDGGDLAVADGAEGAADPAAQDQPGKHEAGSPTPPRRRRRANCRSPSARSRRRPFRRGTSTTPAATAAPRPRTRTSRARDRRPRAAGPAGQEARRRRSRARRPSTIVRMRLVWWSRDMHGRRVAADHHERSVPDRDLTRVAGQDVEAEHGDEEDPDLGDEPEVVVAEDERQDAEHCHRRRRSRRR